MANEANDSPFDVRVTGDTTEEIWTGTFRAKKRLSHRDHLRKDSLRREFLGSQPGTPTDRALSTAMILSELAVRLTKSPSWWIEMGGGLDLSDDNVIGVLFDEVMKIEREAAEEKKKAAATALEEMKKEAADSDK